MNTSLSSLDGIPVEIMEYITTPLEIHDICSLRLVSRQTSAKCMNREFKKRFHKRKIQLYANADQDLHDFVHSTQPGKVGCFVQHLTLVGSPAVHGEPIRERRSTELLSQAMKNLRLNSLPGFLSSLSLVVETNNILQPWRSVWEASADLFHITALALHTSGLPIESMDIFSQIDRCSLACSQIGPILDETDMTTSFSRLKKLSLSLSHHLLPSSSSQFQNALPVPQSEEMQHVSIGRRNTTAICQFLKLCPQLECLQLHWYKLVEGNALSNALTEEQHFFDRISRECEFPCLKRCFLFGIKTSEIALLLFLRQVQLTSFVMEEVTLREGTFRSIFDYLVNNMEELEIIRLDNLWEGRLVQFEDAGTPHFPIVGRVIGPNEITRTGADVRRPIGYGIVGGRAKGSAAVIRWRTKRIRLYGPP